MLVLNNVIPFRFMNAIGVRVQQQLSMNYDGRENNTTSVSRTSKTFFDSTKNLLVARNLHHPLFGTFPQSVHHGSGMLPDTRLTQ